MVRSNWKYKNSSNNKKSAIRSIDYTISYEDNRYALPKRTYSAHKDVILNIVGDLLEIKILALNLIVSYKITTGKDKLIQK